MNAILTNISPSNVKQLYVSLFYKTKDKADMVLEPLQAIIQLAMLSVCPVGTKLAIKENILYLQPPTVMQPLSRWYNSDKKDDLLFLFQVIRRFIKWYNPTNNRSSPISLELYKLLVNMAIQGLDKLFKTYISLECNTIMQVVNMYKNLLQTMDNQDVDKIFNDTGINMDEVFQKIITIYDSTLLSLISNALTIVDNETDEIILLEFINGFNLMLKKNNITIQNWIKDNLIL